MTKFTAEEPDVVNDIINMAIQALDVLANKLAAAEQRPRQWSDEDILVLVVVSPRAAALDEDNGLSIHG